MYLFITNSWCKISDCISIHKSVFSRWTVGLNHSTESVWIGLNQSCTLKLKFYSILFHWTAQALPGCTGTNSPLNKATHSLLDLGLNQVVLQDIHIFCCIHFTVYLYKTSSACCQGASPLHDAATTMLHDGDGVFVVTCSGWCPPNIAFNLMVKKLSFGPINNLLAVDLRMNSTVL